MCTTSCTYDAIIGRMQNHLFHSVLIFSSGTGADNSWSMGSSEDVKSDTDTLMAFIILESPSPPKLASGYPDASFSTL